MRALSRGLTTSLEATTSVEHNLTKGELREDDLRTALRPHIPRRYELVSGIIVNSSGEQSRQQDVIVSEGTEIPSFIARGGITVQPIEAVVATLEVKSAATPETVTDGVAKAVSVASLLPEGLRTTHKPDIGSQVIRGISETPFAGIVALRSDRSDTSLVEAFIVAHKDVQPHDRCNALVVVGDFVLCWTDGQSFAALPGASTPRLARIHAGDDALLVFYVLLMLSISRYHRPELDFVAYLDGAGIEPDVDVLDPKWT